MSRFQSFCWWPPAMLTGFILGAAISWHIESNRPQLLAQDRAVTSRRSSQGFAEAGSIEPVHQVELRSPITSRLEKLLVSDGARVEKGQLLMVLDDSEAERDYAKVSARLAEVEHILNHSRKTLEAVEAERELTERVSAARIEAAELRVSAAENQVRNETPPSTVRADIAAARLGVLEAKLANLRMRNELQLRSSEAELAMTQAGLQLKETRLAHEQVRERLASCKVLAPTDGIYMQPAGTSRVASRGIKVGQQIQANSPLGQVIATDRYQFSVRVHETRISAVTVGQSVTVTLDAAPETPLKGTVITVAATPSIGTFPNTNRRDYKVVIRLTENDIALLPGLTGRAEFGDK